MSTLRVLTQKQVDFYRENGYLIIKDFLTDEQVQKFKKGCKSRPVGDTACHPEYFDYITISKPVVDIVKDLIGEKVVYPGLSFTRTEDFPKKAGSRILHSDAAYENNDFSKERKIINSGFYLQDQTNYSGSLKIIPGSQNRPRTTVRTVKAGLKKIVQSLLEGDIRTALNIFDSKGSINLDSMPRDLMLWSTRVHHSGYGLRFKWFPTLSLLPVLENWVPRWMHVPNNPERDVILTIYGTPGEEFEKYMKVQRVKSHRKEHFLASNFEREDIQTVARETGITMRNDGYEYASDPESSFVVRSQKKVASGDV